MYTLGISAYYHNSAAAIVANGEVMAAAEEERFSRKKNDPAFPEQAIRFCLSHCGITLADLDAIVFYDKPFLKFERLLETYLTYAPKGFISYLTAIPIWIKEKFFLKNLLYRSLQKIEPFDRKKVKLLFSEHHLSHAASAFYPSPFQEAAILTLDGIGEWATTTISKGEENKIQVLREQHFPHSIGLLYSSFTYYLGFEVNSGEYKLMGLAPYGNRESNAVKGYIDKIKAHLCTLYPDGSVFLHMNYFEFHVGKQMTNNKAWERLFGFPRKEANEETAQYHCDLAYAIQAVTEEIIYNLASEAKRLTNAENLCLAGGVALNCVANGKLQAANLFKHIFIQPAAGDSGGALGAAMAIDHLYFNQPRSLKADTIDGMKGAYLGPSYTEEETLNALKKFNPDYQRYEAEEELLKVVAALLADGKVIGWHQGRLEYGPRALGARSILADPRNQEMQRNLNLKVKFRESFRPFAPMVMAEYADAYFELPEPSPYMLIAKPIKEEMRFPLLSGFAEMRMEEKLMTPKSNIPAATHVDFTCRIQTVHKELNLRLWKLMEAFLHQTGCPVLVNTSFNVKDEPIVNTPADAYQCFLKTNIDYLVIGNLVFSRKPATLQ
jgi:carbamoyltransferase